jgi:cysteine synthase A
MEQLNPGGSIKDRPARAIIEHGLSSGAILSSSVVIESSSGNMGVGLAQVCCYYSLRFICVVDQKATSQHVALLRAYGAEVEIVGAVGPPNGENCLRARIGRVKELANQIPNSFWPNQYSNRLNSGSHLHTMHEISTALNGRFDYLFCAVSTCGTLRGCSEYRNENHLRTRIIAVDAVGSVIFGGPEFKRLIPGHGAAIVPDLYQKGLADECICVSDLECVLGCHRLLRREAILAGGSSGAIVSAIERSLETIPPGAVCVAVLPDRGERYLNTIYSQQWIADHFGTVSI